jgi:hypothetical protein
VKALVLHWLSICVGGRCLPGSIYSGAFFGDCSFDMNSYVDGRRWRWRWSRVRGGEATSRYLKAEPYLEWEAGREWVTFLEVHAISG